MASRQRAVKSAGRRRTGRRPSASNPRWGGFAEDLRRRCREANTDRNAASAEPTRPAAFFAVVSRFNSFDNYAPLRCFVATAGRSGGNAMDMLFGSISAPTFWKILLFVHFALAVVL